LAETNHPERKENPYQPDDAANTHVSSFPESDPDDFSIRVRRIICRGEYEEEEIPLAG
jgi:hypothetical protein